MSDKINELLLIDVRPDAPLVRITRDYEGRPVGTLGYIAGVEGAFLRVVLAGSDKDDVALLLAREVENV